MNLGHHRNTGKDSINQNVSQLKNKQEAMNLLVAKDSGRLRLTVLRTPAGDSPNISSENISLGLSLCKVE